MNIYLRTNKGLYRAIFITALFCLGILGKTFSQKDSVFWFVAPEVAQSHADDSVKFRFAGPAGTAIKIELPSDPTNVLFPITGTIPASGSLSIRVTTAQKNVLENKPANTVLTKGMRIRATNTISAYYEVNSVGSPSAGANNPEIFALKGENALGTSFVIPAQNLWANGPVTNPQAKSGIDIVATENGTTVTITMGATATAVGHAAGSTFTITLNKGETYSIEQQSTAAGSSLAGTVVTSNKKVAVTIKEDSVYLNGLGGCYDLAGDQLIPTDIIGNKYIIAKGSLYNVTNSSQQLDKVVIMPALTGATITIYSGSPASPTVTTVTRGAGQIYIHSLTSGSIYIESTAPVYVYHYTGYGCEVGSAIVPPILCTGANTVSAVRSVDNTGYEFQLVVFAPSAITGSFSVNGDPTLTSALIGAFADVPGTAGLYKAAKVSYTPAQIAAGQVITVSNPAGLFHAGIINGDETTGARYGFFSDYSRLKLQTSLLHAVSCFGGNDAELGVEMIGGLAPYTYQWSTGANTQSINSLSAGTYKAVVKDASGCKDSITAVITQPTKLNATVLPQNIINNCIPETSTGSAIVTATGGTTAYSYSINNLASTQTSNVFMGLAEGNYSIIVQDANLCKDTAAFVILDPNGGALDLNVDLSGITNICVPGTNTGQVTINAVGGFTPYRFSLDGALPLVTNTVFSGLSQGSHFIYAVDNNGCRDTVYFTIQSPTTQLAATVTPNSLVHNCVPGGAAGQVAITATGGYTPYTYRIQGATTGYTVTQASNSFTGLLSDNYTVTVTDANGCVATVSFQILSPSSKLAVSLTSANITCNGLNNGSVQATVTGGYPAYSYLWNTGATSATINSLLPGTYKVKVTDVNGCVDSASTIITQPMFVLSATAQVVSNYNGQNVSCNAAAGGTPNGVISATPNGGTAPYTYAWSNGATTQTVNNVGAGTYNVTVTDANGCTTTTSVTVTQPPVLTSSSSVTSNYNGQQISCNGAADGSASVTPNGGTAPYTYAWSNGATTQAITNLTAGTYTVTITDANGCTTTSSVTVTQPAVALSTTAQVVSNYNGQNVSCNASAGGTPNGVISATPNGGTAPYTYAWSNGATTQTVNNVGAGTYTVTVTDVNGCSTTANVTVSEPPILTSSSSVTSNYNGQNISCNGAANGSVSVTPNGGTAPFTYAWSNGGTTQAITNLTAGTYSVTVTDANGCTTTSSVTVTQPAAAVSATASVISNYNGQNVSCNASAGGTPDGIISTTPSGGTAPYTYVWSNGAATQTVNNVGAGTYTVTVTDVNGCSTTANVTVSEPPTLTSSSSVTSNYNGQNISCNGATDGSASVTPTGGTAPFTYVWSNGSTTQVISNLSAGTYNVTVTDANGCTSTSSVTVTQPTFALSATAQVVSNYNGQNVSCNASAGGTPDGIISVTPNGGTAPYTYAWSNGATTQTVNNVGAGTYTVTVKDANGCTTTANVTVNEPPILTSSSSVTSNYNGQNISCNGAADGSASVTPTGGTAPFTYVWNNGGTTQSISNLVAGTYNVTVTDANGCSTSSSVIVTQPAAAVTATAGVTSNYNGQNVSCNASSGGTPDGSLSVSPSGGTAPYTYLWSNGSTLQNPTGIGAGTYNVTVTDVNGCNTTTSVTVTQPPVLTSSSSVTSNYNGQQISCNGAADGSASVTPNGGTAPYTYAWSNGGTTQSINNLSAGTYNVTVTDANGCTTTSSVTVTQPAFALSTTASVISNYNGQDVSCNASAGGTPDGIISATPTGGTAPYTYAWSNGATTQTVNNVGAGTYTVTVTDVNGCTTTANVTVSEPPTLTSSSSVTSNYNGQNISCNGAADGSVSVTPNGGTAPFTYLWNNGGTTQTISNLSAGTYNVTVTDANGCSTTSSVTVTQPTFALSTTASVISNYNGQDVSCNASAGGTPDGIISATPNGGTAPYTYAWSNGATTQTVNNVGAGTYTVTVTDVNGCTTTANVTVSEPPTLTSSSSVTSNYNGQNISCNGAADGSASVTPTGGTAPFTYLWNNGATTQSISNLVAGTYNVTVMDANGCSTTSSVTVTQPAFALTSTAQVVSNYNGQDVSCNASAGGTPDGIISATPNGGTAPYTYAWSNGATTQTVNNVGAGTYTVTVTDVNGCTTTANVTVNEPPTLTSSSSVTSNYNGQNISCNGASDGSVSVTPNGGTAPFTYVWSNGGTTQAINNLSAGTYNVTVTDANGCSTTSSVTVTQPTFALSTTASVISNYNGQDVSCNASAGGTPDGIISATPNGGTAPYTYAWSNGATTQTVNNVGAGTYTVTVTDVNGCTTTANVTVNEPPTLTSSSSVTSNYNGQNISCNGASDGSVSVTPNGGTAPFTYVWSNGGTTQAINNLSAGTYNVTVTDANGCSTTSSVTVTQPTFALSTTASVISNYNGQDVSCNASAGGTPDGIISATPSGGTAPYTYVWSNGATTQTVNNVGAGTYNVTVTDVNGCATIANVTVSEPPTLTSSSAVTSNYNGQNISCNGAADGSVSVTPNGGTAPFTYVWSNGGTTQSINNLSAGTYNVTVTDANGCSTSSSVTVTQPAVALSTTASVISNYNGQDVSCNASAGGTPDGIISATPNGGTAPYTYVWSNGATTQTVNNVGAGTYTVTVTDVNGCTTTANVTVNEPPTLTSSSSVTSNYNGQNISCNGAADGSASVTPNGGTAPFTYVWSNGSTTQAISNLSAGTYNVTVTDANGCSTTSSVTVTQPAFALTSTAQVVSNYNGQDVSCNASAGGTPDGIISATPTGGTAPYTYVWSNGSTTQTVNNVGAGTYTVTVTDVNGCTTTANVTVSEPPTLTSSSSVTSNYNGQQISCNGASDGSVSVTPNGGTAPFTYVWSNGGTTQSINNLSAGTYNVTVTDANGCSTSSSVTVTQPAVALSTTAQVVSNYNGQDVSCNASAGGTPDGVISATPTGGTAPYTYAWSNGATTQTVNNVGAGTYTVTVADVNGCTTTANVTVSEPPTLTSSSSVTSNYNGQNISCNGASDGSASVTPNGGTAPFTYVWSNGSTTQAISNLSAGTYNVTVTDVNGCSTSSSVTVTQPTFALSATTSVISNYNGQDVSCNASAGGTPDGIISATPTGGTAPYTYVWSNGSTTQTVNNVGAGTYTVTVTDVNGCSTTANVTVNQPPTLTSSSSVTSNYNGQNISCNGAADGSASVTPNGGTAPFTYVWSNGGTTQSISNLVAGTYNVTVTDANGCSTTSSVTVTQPVAVVSATANVTSNYHGQAISCNGNADGAVIANPSGGTAPYTYVWSNGATTQAVAGLVAGSYTVTVADVNGCSATAAVTVTQPTPLASTSAVVSNYNGQNVSCNAASNGTPDGIISASPTGGTAPYTYAWSNGSTLQTPTGVGGGTYTVIVTDVNGCSVTNSVTVVEPDVLTSSASVASSYNGQHISCNGGNNGSVSVVPVGGTAPYTYLWNEGSTSQTANGLVAGTYSVVVTDANGCTTSSSITVTQPAALQVGAAVTNVLCNGASTGIIDLNVSGGVTPYTYGWSNGQTTEDAINLPAGSYTVHVTDANNCSINFTRTVTQPAQAVSGTITVEDVSCFGGNNGSLYALGSGGVGTYTYQWTGGPTTSTYNGLSTGTYEVTIKDANGCPFITTGTVGQPATSVSVSGVSSNVLCYGNNTGSIDLTASGGTPGYTYTWSNGTHNEDATNLAAGTYTVVVTDANGCTNTSFSATITQPGAALDVTGSLTNVKCFQGSDAAIDITVTGGVGPYSYLWSNGSVTEDLINIPVGTYLVTVTDANGCQHFAYSAVVTQASSAIQITGTLEHAACYGDANGGIDLHVEGGEPAYSFDWSNGSTTQNLHNLSAGTYTVLVDDGRGCRRSASFEIVSPPQLVISGNVNDNLCYGAPDGIINVSVAGGTPSYQYSWSNGRTSEDLYNVVPGNYTVTVTDFKGCHESANFTIYEATPIVISLDSLHQIFVGESVELIANVSGGTGSYSYQWTPEDYLSCPTCGSTWASPVANTNYVVTVTDGNNCTVTDNAHVEVIHDIFIPTSFTPGNDDLNNTFKPVVRMAKECSFQIFNRWGEMIYSTLDSNQGWDGTLRGVEVKVDVYICRVKVVFLNGDEKVFEERVTLVR